MIVFYFNSVSSSAWLLRLMIICIYLRKGSTDQDSDGFLHDTYDLIVIGGGTAGLACAKEAAKYNKTVVVLDYVIPSQRGTTWGIGGICINAGCIPKKLFHQAAILRNDFIDGGFFGWKTVHAARIYWKKLAQNVRDYIKSLRWKLRRELILKKIELKKAIGSFIDRNTVNAMALMNNPVRDGYEEFKNFTIKGKHIVISTGVRQSIPDTPKGLRDFCITTDDIFYMKDPPGRTLVIGGGYIGMEVAGFLSGLQYPVTIAIRSKLLKDFDPQMVNLVKEYMIEERVNFCLDCEVTDVRILPEHSKWSKSPKSYFVTLVNKVTKRKTEVIFDTLLCATGGKPSTHLLNLDEVGVEYDKTTGKIPAINEVTNIPHIYAVGDILLGKPELQPVALKAGSLLSRRIFGRSKEIMDYTLVPTVVFTPLEYGRVGWNEDDALEAYGEDSIEVYHSYYYPLEWEISRSERGGDNSKCYIKVITKKDTGNIIGIHFTGPHAGDVIQGYAVAMKAGLTVHQLQSSIGVHPTISEEFTRISVTKSSGLSPRQLPCCS